MSFLINKKFKNRLTEVTHSISQTAYKVIGYNGMWRKSEVTAYNQNLINAHRLHLKT